MIAASTAAHCCWRTTACGGGGLAAPAFFLARPKSLLGISRRTNCLALARRPASGALPWPQVRSLMQGGFPVNQGKRLSLGGVFAKKDVVSQTDGARNGEDNRETIRGYQGNNRSRKSENRRNNTDQMRFETEIASDFSESRGASEDDGQHANPPAAWAASRLAFADGGRPCVSTSKRRVTPSGEGGRGLRPAPA